MSPHLTRRRLTLPLAAALAAGPLLVSGAGTAASSAATSPAPVVRLEAMPPQVVDDGRVQVPLTNTGSSAARVHVDVVLPGSSDPVGTAEVPLPAHAEKTVALPLSGHAVGALRAATTENVIVTAGDDDDPDSSAMSTRHVTLVAAPAVTADPANPGNPLARPWATYEGSLEPAWTAYTHAHGTDQRLLAPVALLPKARWFTSGLTPQRVGDAVHRYVRDATANDPDALVQLTMFVLRPWEGAACQRMPTAAEAAHDRAAITAFVDAIGSAHAMVVVQPDGPFGGCEPHGGTVLSDLVGQAVHQLAQLPNTSAYIDMGSADWHRGQIDAELPLLLSEDVEEARGFAMDVTHADAVAAEVRHAHVLVRALARAGAGRAHAVIDTSDNGRPFGGADWHAAHPGADTGPWAAPACSPGVPASTSGPCVVLGIPPTTDVAAPRWGLAPDVADLAARDVDAYLWIKRPWLDPFHGYRFSLDRALDELRTSPIIGRP